MSVCEYTAADWKPGGRAVVGALRGLTRAERRHVEAGVVGDCPPTTLRNLQRKAMFFLHIDSPNGRCGLMKLTPLGESVRATIAARKASDQSQEGGK